MNQPESEIARLRAALECAEQGLSRVMEVSDSDLAEWATERLWTVREQARAALAIQPAPTETEPDPRYCWENGTLKWTNPMDVGHLIAQLQTLAPAMKVSSVMSIEIHGQRKARAHGLSMSYERWDASGWLDFKNEALPVCLALWAYDDRATGSTPAPSPAVQEAADALADYLKREGFCSCFAEETCEGCRLLTTYFAAKAQAGKESA